MMARAEAILAAVAVTLAGAEARAQCAGGAAHGSMEAHGDCGPGYRSPGLAVALSLTPVPVDFGNLYAEHIGWGVGYTAVELALFTPMMWIAGDHMSGHGYFAASNPWSSGERNAMIGLVSGYVIVKLIAGLHAGYAAEVINRDLHGAHASATIVPTEGGAMAMALMRF